MRACVCECVHEQALRVYTAINTKCYKGKGTQDKVIFICRC